MLIAVAWYGIRWWQVQRAEAELAAERRHALLMAQVWVATAPLRDQPEKYLAFRDSVLAAEGLTAEEMRQFQERYENEPETALRFATTVKRLVDSLSVIQDSLRGITYDTIPYE